ncbi:hypothetical protein ACHQM5_006513 [Ranunculus cassubicifolius]
MPSVQDQLSKLTGTIFICVAMGFMISSIGTNGEFESYANVTALSIFVITVLVNICTQMATGVIFCFFVEHSVVLCCMLILLIRFWLSVVVVNAHKLDAADRNKELIKMDEPSILSRLKLCYLHGYDSCPQFFLSCKIPSSSHVGLVCIVCLLILCEAMFRSLVFNDLKFCGAVSDYGWSVWLMVATQIVTILLASLAIGLRWRTCGDLEEKYDFITTRPYLQILSECFGLNRPARFFDELFRGFMVLMSSVKQ